MEDELELFIRERKARVAQDRASLEQDPPYMEIQAKPHRSHGSLLKENIPPKLTAQENEESSNVGLPLGVEYEKKKKRLQHELRMDYRRYIAQQNGVLRQRPLSRRDVGTLTEAHKESHRALSPPESPLYQVRREMLVDQEPEGEHYTEEKLSEVTSSRRLALDCSSKKTHFKNDDGREESESPSGFAGQGRRSRALNKSDEAEFSTGLLIGEIDTDEILQRRKERYRVELQEQIAEQHRNKKREKDLELKVAATGANDPEKQPNRIRQFGLSKRKESRLLGHSMLGQSESSSSLPNHDKTGVGDRLMPAQNQPHVAFQSPLLECNGGGLSPERQPFSLSFPRVMDTSRIPLLSPHPAHIVSPYREPHYNYSNRNFLDPNLAYYGHLSYPAAGLPLSYYNMPPGGAVCSQLSDTSPQSGSSLPEPTPQPTTETVSTAPYTGLVPPERPKSNRERTLNYGEALKKQILEQQERKRVEREERERYEAKLEADMKRHQPWGRGGGGAPLKDSTGNLIADLKQMHKLNEEAHSNPEWQQRAPAVIAPCPVEHSNSKDRISGHRTHMSIEEASSNPEQQQRAPVVVAACPAEDPNDRISGFTHIQTPQFSRGSVLTNQPRPQQLDEQDKYKAYLKKQIEEKLHKQAEERERNRLEDEKLERKVAEQMARIKREYEEEQEKKKRKEIEQKAKEQEQLKLVEQRKMEAERKKTEEREKAAQKQREQAKHAQVHRESSAPVPTLQKSPRSSIVESRYSTAALSEQSMSGHRSPPVPACRNQLRAAGSKLDVYSELSALRRQLRAEQKRLESHLQQGFCDEMDPVMTGRQSRPRVDVFNMAMLRLQAPVRKPPSRNMEPSNLLQIHDSLQLDYTGRESRLSSVEVERMERVGAASRRRRVYNEPHQKLSSQRPSYTHGDFDVCPTHQNDLESVMGRHARGSLLESDSAFLAPLGDAFSVPSSPEAETTLLSARERRRLTKQSQHSLELDNPTHSGSRKQREAESSGEEKSQEKMSPACGGNRAGTVDLSDDDLLPPQISQLTHNRQSSIESFSTDPWMRPGTSETLKCLEESMKRDRLTT
ncbi:centrosome and spindle pole-associated protein 1 isoform X1 [Hippocampus comes]|uniref:centrosome and spindle pole-associated protein 1 isoform X1 n=1 Tax=Hippocampus comes TaxID=109280 RepID=UPI00094F0E85|nr:PREDICTED: centrosome and spindle pole-associated protein 1 isoform X1 [Hippocampus comes]XP_019739792.1 PREDICTED: centrosome and spindle pole-associated protein 1 isoform X1 [Hippocampus comes]XP_019739793.1 PREDICTED: centrosome and spindle pole-associated protein 1 isoform X1 [Hippocampus comes]XP_019739794.1 PREDICTED: centrosome and spindle pole-associated protein 1 isoform X1 [Hippocampus comes]